MTERTPDVTDNCIVKQARANWQLKQDTATKKGNPCHLHGLYSFHHYCFGSLVMNITDQKSVVIFQKNVSILTPRLPMYTTLHSSIQCTNQVYASMWTLHWRLPVKTKSCWKQRWGHLKYWNSWYKLKEHQMSFLYVCWHWKTDLYRIFLNTL